MTATGGDGAVYLRQLLAGRDFAQGDPVALLRSLRSLRGDSSRASPGALGHW